MISGFMVFENVNHLYRTPICIGVLTLRVMAKCLIEKTSSVEWILFREKNAAIFFFMSRWGQRSLAPLEGSNQEVTKVVSLCRNDKKYMRCIHTP